MLEFIALVLVVLYAPIVIVGLISLILDLFL